MTDSDGCAIVSCEEREAWPFCARHRGQLEEALAGGLARSYVELNQAVRGELGKQTSGSQVVVSMSREQRVPIGLGARALQESLVRDAVELEDRLRASQGWISRPPRGREGPTLQGSCEVLSAHLDELLEDGESVARLATLLRRSIGANSTTGKRSSRSNTVDAPCSACGVFALLRRNGTDRIACGHCGAEASATEVDAWLAA